MRARSGGTCSRRKRSALATTRSCPGSKRSHPSSATSFASASTTAPSSPSSRSTRTAPSFSNASSRRVTSCTSSRPGRSAVGTSRKRGCARKGSSITPRRFTSSPSVIFARNTRAAGTIPRGQPITRCVSRTSSSSTRFARTTSSSHRRWRKPACGSSCLTNPGIARSEASGSPA